MQKVAAITANLGGFDKEMEHVPQSLLHDKFVFTDENFPPRFNSMTPRLQAKIPKCFGWQMAPGYDFYFWIDGNLTMTHPDTIKYFYDNCQGYDIVVLKHPRRNSARWEGRYLRRGLKLNSRYLLGRYEGEWLADQMAEIEGDKDFVDDILVNGGAFMYRNTAEVQKMLKEWWYHMSRYLIMDQCSFAYVLKKSGLRINIRPDDLYNNTPYLSHRGHIHHN
jgi:hypothetical protein